MILTIWALIIVVMYCTGRIIKFLMELWTEIGKIRVLLELMYEGGKKK
jgi:hypothetical protein